MLSRRTVVSIDKDTFNKIKESKRIFSELMEELQEIDDAYSTEDRVGQRRGFNHGFGKKMVSFPYQIGSSFLFAHSYDLMPV